VALGLEPSFDAWQNDFLRIGEGDAFGLPMGLQAFPGLAGKRGGVPVLAEPAPQFVESFHQAVVSMVLRLVDEAVILSASALRPMSSGFPSSRLAPASSMERMFEGSVRVIISRE